MSRLSDHLHDSVHLLTQHALDGHAEGVWKRAPRDDQIVSGVLHTAMFALAPQLEKHGAGFVILRHGLTDRQYALIASIASGSPLQVSLFEDATRTTPTGKTRRWHYLHTGSMHDLAKTLRKLKPNAPLPVRTL